MKVKLGWELDAKTAGLTFLTVQSYQAFRSSCLPNLYDMRQADDSSPGATRVGQSKAVIETLILGVGASLASESWWPLVAPVAFIVLDTVFYSWALDNGPIVQVDIEDE